MEPETSSIRCRYSDSVVHARRKLSDPTVRSRVMRNSLKYLARLVKRERKVPSGGIDATSRVRIKLGQDAKRRIGTAAMARLRLALPEMPPAMT